MKHSSTATHVRGVGVGSHMEKCKQTQKGEPGTFFCNQNCEGSYLQGDLSPDLVSVVNGLTVCLHIRVLTASSNYSAEEVP